MGSALEEQLALLRSRYLAKIPDKQAQLKELWRAYTEDTTQPHLEALRGAAHKLKGSGATYGFDDISTHAAALEKALVAAREDDPTSIPDDLPTLFDALLDALTQALQ